MIKPPPGAGKTLSPRINESTRIYVLIQGMLIGLAGMAHGIFETQQGNVPTGAYLISFGIFTVIPNYLATGITAIAVALSVILWTSGFVHKRNGPLVFLLLCLLLFLVGGGVAQLVFIFLTWAISTRIDKPLAWWKKTLPDDFRKQIANIWPAILACDYLIFLIAIGIWLVLSQPSAVSKAPTGTEYTLWSLLVLGILMQPLVIVSGFARDIERRSAAPQAGAQAGSLPT